MNDRPMSAEIMVKDTRTRGFAQVTVLAILLLLLMFQGAGADSTGTATVTVIPLGGKARGVRLRAQAVDVVVRQDADGVWADTKVWMKLDNPATKLVTVTVIMPGPQLGPSELPADLRMEMGGASIPLQPESQDPDSGPELTAQIGVPARKSVELQVTYRQALPESEGRVTYAYFLTALDQWRNTPESVRLTLSFDPPIDAGQLLIVAPPSHESDGRMLNWDWEIQRPQTNIGLAFMSSAWWAGFSAARTAAADPAAGVAEHLALSQYYQHLLALPDLPFTPPGFFEQNYAPAVAALQVAIASASPNNPASESVPEDLIAAHRQLAELYRRQAGRAAPSAAVMYLRLAAQEADAALALRTSDSELREMAADLYRQLAEAARAAGETDTVAEAEARLATLAVRQSADPSETPASLDLARAALDRGDLWAAAEMMKQATGQDTVASGGLAPPRARQSLVKVITSPATRTITLTLVPITETAAPALADILHETALALGSQPGVAAAARGSVLVISLTSAGDRGPGLARALPAAPELALLASVLAPTRLSLSFKENPFRSTLSYVEEVNLEPARQRWQELSDPDAVSGRGPSEAIGQDAGTGEAAQAAEPLPALQHDLWAASAAAWQEMAASSRVEYVVELKPGSGAPAASHQWSLPAGAARTLELQASDWRLDRIRWAAMGGAGVLFLVAAAIWRWT